MSIMDHDPKYAKLLKWREDHQFEYPPRNMRRLEMPLQKMVVRLSVSAPLFDWKPITGWLEKMTTD